MKILIPLLLILLTGCISAQKRAQMENDKCVSYGYKKGTAGYSDCRLKLEIARQGSGAAVQANSRALIKSGTALMKQSGPRILK
jgi:hypothetical protein